MADRNDRATSLPTTERTSYDSTFLLDAARRDLDDLLRRLGSGPDGLSTAAARQALAKAGPNEITSERQRSTFRTFIDNVRNPLVILLVALGAVSYATGDTRGAIVIASMVVLGVVLRFVQERRSDRAAEKLRAIVGLRSRVVRDGHESTIAAREVVPGDILLLSAGDIVPADARIVEAHDLYIDQSTLTGESMPVARIPGTATATDDEPLELSMLCFQGSHVQTGSCRVLALATGGSTYFGALAGSVAQRRPPTSFDTGIDRFTWLIIRLMMVMVPLVFVINGLSRGDWVEAFLFALAVAVGLTPEMLPMIVTVNLSKGAIAMSRQKVIVKRLNSIQDLGAMDVLCTDKTGTLTQGRIVLVRHVDVDGHERDEILRLAYLNSFFETGLKNLMDVAILEHAKVQGGAISADGYTKVDEIPFDFQRRRLSVVVDDPEGRRLLICKGAIEEVMVHCAHITCNNTVTPLDAAHHYPLTEKLIDSLNRQGFRVVALASRSLPAEQRAYSVDDENDMVLIGFLAFLDPPKDTAAQALQMLAKSNVRVKILTGDNDVVTRTICDKVGLAVEGVLLGAQVEAMNDEALDDVIEGTTVFAKLSPSHKVRVISALRRRGHVVGYMGDGINDAPALKGSDVGISVDTAADIARESSDIILLDSSLLVLHAGVIAGRRVFGNVVKYIRMAASSNFGNMLSVVGASAFLPFVPMLPIQILTNNLLYDFSQTTIPTDDVDDEWLRQPRQWAIDDLRRYILFIGPISSLFDYLTFGILLAVFHAWDNPALFHTGWFVESLFTQTLIIHVIRTNRIPFVESRASWQLTLTTIIIVAVGAWLPVSPLAPALGLVPLPPLFWLLLAGMLIAYIALTQVMKTAILARIARRSQAAAR